MRARLAAGVLVIGLIGVAVPISPAATATPAWTVTSGRVSAAARLSAVSCVSPTSCQAVGLLGNNTATSKVLAESWNGTSWSVVPSSGPNGSWLFGVSCVAADWCQAVGWANNTRNVLVEHWDGRAWSKTANPEHRTSIKQLGGVSCISKTWCMAVGNEFNEHLGYSQPLAELWNGHVWKLVPSPFRALGADLDSVACLSPTSCQAVGSTGNETLVDQWDGRTWTRRASPNPGRSANYLDGISCVSTVSCAAVGSGNFTFFYG